MRLQRLIWIGLGITLVVSQAGCCAWDRFRTNHPRLFGDNPGDPFVDRRDDFRTRGPNFPIGPAPGSPAVVPGAPGGAEILTPQPYPSPGSTPVPPAGPPTSSGYGPDIRPKGNVPAEYQFPALPPVYADSNGLRIPSQSNSTAEPPLAPSRRAAEPGEAKSETDKPIVKNLPPDLLDPKGSAKPPLIAKTETEPSPGLPVGIPAFWQASDKIAVGLKPDPEGLDWLRANKYQSVLHLRRKGSDDSAHKEQAAKRGLKYSSLEISAATLTKDQAAEFSKLVTDAANQPLFIYDEDGSLVGAMWYVHLRTTERMPAELAKTKAERIGLREQGTAEQNALWAAIQLILKDQQP
jgi:protein tyrosine phosphatase (PTP) superfamily phosphohydrolase (DUF442 family)